MYYYGNNVIIPSFVQRRSLHLSKRRSFGPGSLTRILVLRRECLPQNINPISPTPKFILGITQIITKAYQFTKCNQNRLICTIQCLTFLPNLKGQGLPQSQTFYLNNVLHVLSFNLICTMTAF